MKRFCAVALAAVMLAVFTPVETLPAAGAAQSSEFRAVWVASTSNLDYPSKKGLTSEQLKKEADAILDKSLALGFNAVILQVRPASDALYKSAYFPWSAVLTGTQGVAPDGGFDPLAYWVEGAHKRGLELHAWINPYRVATNAKNVSGLAENNPARKNPDWVIAYDDGNLYYDPGIPAVRKMVVDGVSEIVQNYAVDGVHFDDYFYPGQGFDDAASFKSYPNGFAADKKAAWRRNNIDMLIKETYDAVKGIRKSCRFGVAPQAIWANKSDNPLGSDTRGNQTYYVLYADTRKWVKEGWLDYIAPQIYWEIGKKNSDYKIVLEWWVDVVRGTGVDLYVGHATFLLSNTSQSSAWYGTAEIKRQIELNRQYPEVKGSIHFRYAHIAGSSAISAAIKTLHSDSATPVVSLITHVIPPVDGGRLAVGRPAGDETIDASAFYLVGASDPTKDLTINGVKVTYRTPSGFFGYHATLKKGANVFVFEQPGGDKITRVITVPDGSGGTGTPAPPPVLDSAVIVAGSALPELFDEMRSPGDKVTLSCTAPIGATVTAYVGGQTITLSPARTSKPSDGKIYSTTFSGTYTIPAITVRGHVLSFGAPLYTMTYGGQTSTRRATAEVKCIGEGAPLYAEVTAGYTFAYPGATTTGGSFGELDNGQKDYVTAQTGGTWVRLASGQWVLRKDVKITSGTAALLAAISDASYQTGAKWDTLLLRMDEKTATRTSYSNKVLTFTVSSADSAPPVALPAGALASKSECRYSGTSAVYTLTFADSLEGYYVEVVPEGIALHLKRRPAAQSGDKPLQGLSIVLDAGHGGTDGGAPGPLGSQYNEKFINLHAVLKLQDLLRGLGANVILTRSEDRTTDVVDRLELSRDQKPDLFLSLHCNSMSYDTNSETIRGIVCMYRDNISIPFAESLYSQVWNDLGLKRSGCYYYNLYVSRATWAPSALLEMGFICNPYDYEYLTDDSKLNGLMSSVAQAIVMYFS